MHVLAAGVLCSFLAAAHDSGSRFSVYDNFDVCIPTLADEASVVDFGIESVEKFETLGWLCTVPGCTNAHWCPDPSTCFFPTGASKIISMFPVILGTGPPWCTGPTKCINGGVPQRANVTAQLELIRDNIGIWLPDARWAGFASIDFEFWSPVWAENAGSDNGQSFHSRAYRDYSIQLVRDSRPGLNGTAIAALAEAEFTRAAVAFMAAVLRELHRLRPLARFGFYGIPNNDYCNFVAKANCLGNAEHAPILRARNNKLQPIWAASGALYPSVYMTDGFSDVEQWAFVADGVTEAIRCAQLANNATDTTHHDSTWQHPPQVLPFQWSYYHGGRNRTTQQPTSQGDGLIPVTASQAAIPFQAAYEAGADGMVMWDCPGGWLQRGGAPNTIASRLNFSRRIFFDVVGPLISNVQQSIAVCSMQQCNGHGTCHGLFHGKNGSIARQQAISAIPSSLDRARLVASGPRTLWCQCDPGWTGLTCNHAASSRAASSLASGENKESG